MEHGPPSTLEGDPSHTILMNITAEASEFGMAIFQNSIWQFIVTVTPGNPGNTMVPVVIDSGLTTTQRNTDFIPGATIRFTNVQATVNLQGLTCLEVDFFCVRINLIQSLQLVGVPDESSLQACSPVTSCGGKHLVFCTKLFLYVKLCGHFNVNFYIRRYEVRNRPHGDIICCFVSMVWSKTLTFNFKTGQNLKVHFKLKIAFV